MHVSQHALSFIAWPVKLQCIPCLGLHQMPVQESLGLTVLTVLPAYGLGLASPTKSDNHSGFIYGYTGLPFFGASLPEEQGA
jgi:hypothetical protein